MPAAAAKMSGDVHADGAAWHPSASRPADRRRAAVARVLTDDPHGPRRDGATPAPTGPAHRSPLAPPRPAGARRLTVAPAADRVCVLSDVHGNVHALEAVLDDVARRGCDALVVAGDLAAHGPTPVEAVDRLRGLDAVIVRGNTDRYLAEGPAAPAGRDPEQADSLRWTRERLGDERLRFLGALPPAARLGDWLVVHASPGDDERGLWPDTAEAELSRHCQGGALLCGHTHQPFDRRLQKGQVVNVGSVGWPLDGDPRPSYAVLERGRTGPAPGWRVRWRRVDYDRARPLAELERRRDGDWVTVAGLVICRQRPGTAKGLCFVTLEDETGLANVVVTPKLFEAHKRLVRRSPILVVGGVLQVEQGVLNVRARRFAAPHPAGGAAFVTSRDFH